MSQNFKAYKPTHVLNVIFGTLQEHVVKINVYSKYSVCRLWHLGQIVIVNKTLFSNALPGLKKEKKVVSNAMPLPCWNVNLKMSIAETNL